MEWYYNEETGNFSVGSIPTKEVVIDEVTTYEEEEGWKLIDIRPEPHDDYIYDGLGWLLKPVDLVAKMKEVEQAVQAHINQVVTSRGYDNENSIAKYLVVGNPFYDECKTISLWIGAVWMDMFNYKNGTKAYTTTEVLMASLPEAL